MGLSRRALLALATLLIAPLPAFILFADDGVRKADAQAPLSSENVAFVTDIPGTASISGVFSRSAPYFYVSGVNAVDVIDVKDPAKPQLVGKLPNVVFENEAMTEGERVGPDGKSQRFILIGNDLGQAGLGSDGPSLGRINGKELIIVDVTDPANPHILSRTPSGGAGTITTSTHTVACMNAACTIAYTAGRDRQEFSILDLSDLEHPKEVKTIKSPAEAPNPVFTGGAGHHWNVDGARIVWHTGSGGTAAWDISDPLNPRVLTTTDENGTKSPYNDFIHHNSQRPNALAYRPGQPLSVQNGNVVLVTEEDYANDGDEVDCTKAGTFQTWELTGLDGTAKMHPLDIINPPAEGGGGLTMPAGAFCSAHWFDFHPSGIVAQGYYQQGLRLIDTRNPRDLKQFGYFTGGATEVWDAYWAPARDPSGAVIPGRKTRYVYTTDAVQGVGVYEVKNLPPDLPTTGETGDRGTFPAAPETPAQAASGSAAQRAPSCSGPSSRFTRKRSGFGRRAVVLRGSARDAGCLVKHVDVAIARKVGRQCRFLQASGRFGKRRSCLRTQYVRAAGTSSWVLRIKRRLPRGRYIAWSRAYNENGDFERKHKPRNFIRGKV
jgi:hypothetical protein